MAVILNASTSSGFVQTADTSGIVQVQNNGTTRLEANGTGVVVTGTGSVSGDLSFNSGYGSSAIAYGCRAWVNFNGDGTVAIRGSGNVSSITDNGTGNYTVNFSTAMPDANYSVGVAGSRVAGGSISSGSNYGLQRIPSRSTSSFDFYAANTAGTAGADWEFVDVSIFR
jgi:uncharacterized protein (AIM24 family)